MKPRAYLVCKWSFRNHLKRHKSWIYIYLPYIFFSPVLRILFQPDALQKITGSQRGSGKVSDAVREHLLKQPARFSLSKRANVADFHIHSDTTSSKGLGCGNSVRAWDCGKFNTIPFFRHATNSVCPDSGVCSNRNCCDCCPGYKYAMQVGLLVGRLLPTSSGVKDRGAQSYEMEKIKLAGSPGMYLLSDVRACMCVCVCVPVHLCV